MYNFVEDLMGKDKVFKVVLDDEVHRGALVLHEGKVMWPPPKPPKPRSGAPHPPKEILKATQPHGHTAPKSGSSWPIVALGVGLGAIGLFGPGGELLQHLTVFVLACVVGWHVVWNVSPALHTPLMSVTNAVSGIILVGGILVLRGDASPTRMALGGAAILLASINVAGGFLVTQRMLRMFRK
jgi:NAD(P) transhydrogenase subunit alpha